MSTMETAEIKSQPADQACNAPAGIRYSLLAVLLVAALAYWAPWVDHNTAALKLSGQDLAEFVKFIPEIRTGQIRFPRQMFYLPPFVCTLCLVSLAVNRCLAYPRWLRVGMLGLAVLILPGLLPPVWSRPQDLFTAEFRLQGFALVAGLSLVLAHGLFRGIPLRILAVIVAVLALAAILPTQWAFWRVWPLIWTAYATPTIRLGWGLWLTIAAWTALFILAALLRLHLVRRADSPAG